MSETIQSISQGTYTIGETNKLTFSAGPGIKIDEPSAGTVRIGNDETVLWSGDRYWWSDTSNLQLSESVNSFEIIRIKAKDDWEIQDSYFYFPSNVGTFNIVTNGIENNKLVWKSTKFGLSGNLVGIIQPFTFSVQSNKTIDASSGASYVMFHEIVGINRKEV